MMSCEQIAIQLKMRKQTVREIERRALAKMRVRLEALGITADLVRRALNPRDDTQSVSLICAIFSDRPNGGD